ncbi:TorA maturation chaperone TorD [Mesocricetibacter intestinalis]|uniref:TorA maturation chaperone TorD n=1 Tax=Mesocricetibacter intestinalis TaxID=1521930 RepID=A0A4R6VBJ3_9PAST|nr:molecular chaperone [Mesocricetibacter intestinalis]TDQ57196.1 TorA maturation chaperone TorD [Mesocricetibacter intestinalis]
MSEDKLSHFSLISRLFGNLFYRTPQDPLLDGVFDWLKQQGLSALWPLELDEQTEKALQSLQLAVDRSLLAQEYRSLFVGEKAKADCRISAYGADPDAFIAFRRLRAMPEVESADHFGLLFLSASWLEDNTDSPAAQRELFETFLLPCAAPFLSAVEKGALLPFYRALALLSRQILAAMADELEEQEAIN